jgi:riboflavin biosynthesis pyrimidine reductase
MVVTFNIASLDGRIGFGDRLLLHGDDRWDEITKRPGVTLADMDALHAPQAMLEGSNTFVARDAPPLDLPPGRAGPADHIPAELAVDGTRWFTALDSRGRVRWTYKEMGGWHLLVLVARSTPVEYLAYLRDEQIPYLTVGDARVDLELAVRRLSADLGVSTILGDGGGILNGALLRAGLVDEVDIQFVPAIIGSPDAPSLFEGFATGPGHRPVQLTPISHEDQGQGFFFVRYAVAAPA